MLFVPNINEFLKKKSMLQEQMLSLSEKYQERTEKLAQSYETLYRIKEIDIATAPKELVWKDGKISLFRYKRD
ncbi:MAG: hypothetical protein ACK40K_02990, partial [Raineya sp.]